MKLTEQDIIILRELHLSQTGQWLAGYLERLVADICDVRKNNLSVEARMEAVKVLEDLIGRIKNQNDSSPQLDSFV